MSVVYGHFFCKPLDKLSDIVYYYSNTEDIQRRKHYRELEHG